MSKFFSFTQGGSSSGKDLSIVQFVAGLILIAIGVTRIFKNTSVGVLMLDRLFGFNLPTGAITLPVLIGITIVFFKHRSLIGWLIIAIGVLAMLIQIILSVRIIFNTTSLWDYFLMFGGTFGGLGLIIKAMLK